MNVTFLEGQIILWPLLHIFSWAKTPQPLRIYAPFLVEFCSVWMFLFYSVIICWINAQLILCRRQYESFGREQSDAADVCRQLGLVTRRAVVTGAWCWHRVGWWARQHGTDARVQSRPADNSPTAAGQQGHCQRCLPGTRLSYAAVTLATTATLSPGPLRQNSAGLLRRNFFPVLSPNRQCQKHWSCALN